MKNLMISLFNASLFVLFWFVLIVSLVLMGVMAFDLVVLWSAGHGPIEMRKISVDIVGERVDAVLDAHDINISVPKRKRVARTLISTADRYDLDPEIILAMIFVESRFDVNAESEVGAVGLMQIRPTTARGIVEDLEIEWRVDLTDPQINIFLGGTYLNEMLERYRRLDHALAAYNVGPSRFDRLHRSGATPVQYARKVQAVAEDMRAGWGF